MEIVEAQKFTKLLKDYLDDEGYRKLQNFLVENPKAGDVMPSCGGFRKVRWGDPRRAKGKRGGLRIIYYFFEEDQQLWLVTLYDKNEEVDLTSEQKRMLCKVIEEEKEARAKVRRKTNL